MSSKKLTEKLFTGNLPVVKDGKQIVQPIFREDTNLIQTVVLTTSKQIISKSATTSTFFSVETDTFSTVGTLEASTIIPKLAKLLTLNVSMIIKAGTFNYGSFYIEFNAPDGSLIARYEKVVERSTMGTDFTITFPPEFNVPAGTTVNLWIRKDCTACTTQGGVQVVWQQL